MSRFLSPGERRVLVELDAYELPVEHQELFYSTEGDVVRLFIDELDAHMIDVAEPQRALQRDETEQEREDLTRRQEHRDFGRKAFGWE